jgi:hypothetical protein
MEEQKKMENYNFWNQFSFNLVSDKSSLIHLDGWIQVLRYTSNHLAGSSSNFFFFFESGSHVTESSSHVAKTSSHLAESSWFLRVFGGFFKIFSIFLSFLRIF